MAAHSFIEIGEETEPGPYGETGRRLILACRESYFPDLAALFTEQEVQDQGERYGYISQVGQLRDRLQLYGYTAQRASLELEAAVSDLHERASDRGAGIIDVPVPLLSASDILAELRRYLNSTDPFADYELLREVEWQLDPRTILRLALDLLDDSQLAVRYNLDDLVSRRLLDRGTEITNQSAKNAVNV